MTKSRKAYFVDYRQRNKEKINDYAADYRQRNKEKIKAKRKAKKGTQ